jgi:hypothetical protein
MQANLWLIIIMNLLPMQAQACYPKDNLHGCCWNLLRAWESCRGEAVGFACAAQHLYHAQSSNWQL